MTGGEALSKAEALHRLRRGREGLLAALQGLSEEEQTQVPAVGEWTVRDVLAHILAWEGVAFQRLDLIKSGRAGEIQWVRAEEVDAYNARFHEAYRFLALGEVSQKLDDTLTLLLERVGSLTDEQLNVADSLEGRPWLPHSTYLHEEEHTAQIAAWRRELETTEA